MPELHRIAVRMKCGSSFADGPEDFEAEAEAVEKATDYSRKGC